jgi:hypothetical protein
MHAHSFCMNVCGSRFVSAHYHIMWVTSRLNLGSTPFSAHFCFFSVQVARQEFPLSCAPSVVPNNLPPTRRDAWTRLQGWRFFGRKVKPSLIQSNHVVRYESRILMCFFFFVTMDMVICWFFFFFRPPFGLHWLFTRRLYFSSDYFWLEIKCFLNVLHLKPYQFSVVST